MQRWRSDSGFSLVEVMVVVAIMGLMASAVVLNLPDAGDKVDDTISRTERAMIALERHSVLTGKIIGVRFKAQGFDTLELGDDGWVRTNDILKPEAMRFDGADIRQLLVAGAEQEVSVEGGKTPQVWFLPTGEKTAFSLTLASTEHAVKLLVPAFGAAKVSVDG